MYHISEYFWYHIPTSNQRMCANDCAFLPFSSGFAFVKRCWHSHSFLIYLNKKDNYSYQRMWANECTFLPSSSGASAMTSYSAAAGRTTTAGTPRWRRWCSSRRTGRARWTSTRVQRAGQRVPPGRSYRPSYGRYWTSQTPAELPRCVNICILSNDCIKLRILDTPWLLLIMTVRNNMAIQTHCETVYIANIGCLSLWRNGCSLNLLIRWSRVWIPQGRIVMKSSTI